MKKLIIIALLAFTLAGCDKGSKDIINDNLIPPGSTNVIPYGPDWVGFKFNGECFMMFRNGYARTLNSAVTTVKCKTIGAR